MAANQVVTAVPSYLPDPHGHALLAGLTGAARRDLTRQRAVVESDPSFDGWAQSPQKFAGLAFLLGGRARSVSGTTAQLSQEKSTTAGLAASDPALGAFYQRMKRGQR